MAEICQRLDGLPLAIELAAARLRALSPAEILAGLHDRFRLLAGGARTAVRRQQTLRASVDWSHDLLTDPERTLLRRLAVFAGGFDLDAAQAVGGGDGLQRHQVLDQLALLVDKSLVSTEESEAATRYRLLETVRQYALEKLAESGEAEAVRTRHRDHYLLVAAGLEPAGREEVERRLDRVEADIDNLRAAFQWSLEISDAEAALRLASSLQPLWLDRNRILEGRSWLDAGLYDEAAGPVAPRCAGAGSGRCRRARRLDGPAHPARVRPRPRKPSPWPASWTIRSCWPGPSPPPGACPASCPRWERSVLRRGRRPRPPDRRRLDAGPDPRLADPYRQRRR